MTTTEVERLSRMLTDMRVENAAQFATLHAALATVSDIAKRVAELEKLPRVDSELPQRVSALEGRVNNVGKFTWADVFKISAAASAAVAVVFTLTHW